MKFSILLGFLLVTVSTVSAAAGWAQDVEEEKEDAGRVRRSDDGVIGSLSVLVQQQAATMQTLQARVTALENTQPASFKPVAFTVRFSRDNSGNGMPLSPHKALQFDSVVTNLGNGYNPQTGIFTAPVTGLYIFFLSAMSPDAHGYVVLATVHQDGTVLSELYCAGSSDPQDQGSAQVTTHLEAGQQVWVRQDYGDAIRGSFFTTFTGCLIQAD